MILSMMTKSQRSEIEKWLRDAADSMNLSDWEFQVMWNDPLDDHRAASTNVQPNSRRARLYFHVDFLDNGEKRCREIACHELLHWAFEPLMEFVDDYAANEMGRKERSIFNSATVQLLEYGIEGTSLAFARHLPRFPVALSL